MTGRGESINNNGDNDGDFDELEDKIDLAFNDVSLASDGATLTFSYPDGSKQVTINGNGAGNEVDLTNYFNKTEVNTKLDLKANTTDVTTALADKADNTDLDAYYLKTETYSQLELDTALALKANDSDVTTALADKADATDLDAYYLKTETYSQTQSDNLIDNAKTHNENASVYNVTVDVDNNGTHKYFINNIQQLELDIIFGKKYIFKHDSAHPLKIGYSDANEYTASFTVDSDTQISFIPFDKDQKDLVYYCAQHPNMGASIKVSGGFNYFDKDETYDRQYIDDTLTGKANTTDVTTALADKADNTDLDNYYLKSETYNQTELDLALASKNSVTAFDAGMLLKMNVTDGITAVNLDSSDPSVLQVTKNGSITNINLPAGGGAGGGSSTDHPTEALTSNTSLTNYEVYASENSENAWKAFARGRIFQTAPSAINFIAGTGYSANVQYYQLVEQAEFSDTPPSAITLTGTWGSAGYNYQVLSHTTESVSYHMVNTANNTPFGGYGIVFTIVGKQLRLYVNDGTVGNNEPSSFSINGNLASEGDVVNGNDTIALILSNSPNTDTFTVPTELIPNQQSSYARYALTYISNGQQNPVCGIFFEVDSNNDLILDVNDPDFGSNSPASFVINGATNVSSGRGVVNVDDVITLNDAGGNALGDFNVPSAFGVAHFYESNEYADNEIFGAETGGFNIVNNNIWKGLGSPQTTTTTYQNVTYKQKYWTSDHSQNVNLENGYVLHLNKLRASHEYARGAYWESHAGVGDWYIPDLVAGATYTYEIYNSMVKTDHYYPVTVNVIGSTTQSTTFTVSGTTDVVASGNIDADTNGRINFTMSCSVPNYGFGLSWIRIKGLNYDANGNFLGSSGLTVDSSLVNGNWLKIQIPTFQTLQTVNIAEVTVGDGLEEFSIYGSSDNSNWTLLQSETSVSLDTYANGGTDYSISTAGNFHYFAVLFTKIHSAVFPKILKISNVTFTTIPSTGGGASFQNSMLNGLNLFSNANYNSTTTPPKLELTAYGSGAVTNVDFPSYVTSSDVSTTLNDYYTQTQTTNLLNDYQLTSSLDTAVGNLGYAKTTSSSGISRNDLEDFNQEKPDLYCDMVVEPNTSYAHHLQNYWKGDKVKEPNAFGSWEYGVDKDFSIEMSHITYGFPIIGDHSLPYPNDGNQLGTKNLPCNYYLTIGASADDIIPATSTADSVYGGQYLRFGIQSKYSKARFTNPSLPQTITFTGYWNNLNYWYELSETDKKSDFCRYVLRTNSGYISAERGIAFSIINDELILNVNADVGGADYPDQFLVNNVGFTGSTAVNVGDEIRLLDPDAGQFGNIVAVFNVPSQFAVYGVSNVLLDVGYVVEIHTPNYPFNVKLLSHSFIENETDEDSDQVKNNKEVVLNRRTVVRFVYDSTDRNYYFVINGVAQEKRIIPTDFTGDYYGYAGPIRLNKFAQATSASNNKIYLLKWWNNSKIEADTKSSIKQLRDEITGLRQEIANSFEFSYDAINHIHRRVLQNNIFASGVFYQSGLNNLYVTGGSIAPNGFIYSHTGINNGHHRWYRIHIKFPFAIDHGSPNSTGEWSSNFNSGLPQQITADNYNVYITERRQYDNNPAGTVQDPNRHKYYNALITNWVVRKRTNSGFELSLDVDDHTNIDGPAPNPQQPKQPWGFDWIAVNHGGASPLGYGLPV